jgi:hypothetical protein
MTSTTLIPIFNSKGKPSSEILSLIFSEGTINRFPTLQKYCAHEGKTVDLKHLSKLRKYIESSLEDQVRRHAFVMYRMFEASNNWNDGPDYQVKLSFGKNILKLSPDAPFNHTEMTQFETAIATAYSEYELVTKTASAAQTEFENFLPSILGKRFLLLQSPFLNRILHFIGSKYYLYLKNYKKGLSVIWGHAKTKKMGIYHLIQFTDEVLRTPDFPITNAANVHENTIMTRHESLNTVFHQKWAPLILDEQEDWRVHSDPYWNISYGIKHHALRLYGLSSPGNLASIQTQLVEEMEESIIFHEIGHTIIREIFLPAENIGIGLGAKQYGCEFYDGMYELLADFAPKHKLGHGAMANMIKISKTNRAKAERMFYTYLSDVWFFDTEDEFMYDYASIVVLCMLRYIQPGLSVDFDALAQDITYQDDRSKKSQLTMLERVQEIFMWDTEEIGNIAKKAEFVINGKPYSFQYVLQDRLAETRKKYPAIEPEGYNFLQPFWTNMYAYLRSLTSEEAKIKSLLEKSVKQNLMKFLVLSCGRTKAEEYEFNHKQYIVDRFYELGLVKYPHNSKQIIS